MKTQPVSFRLPKDAVDKLRSMAQNGESMSGVLLRAIKALDESSLKQPPVTDPLTSRFDELVKRVDGVSTSLGQLITRVKVLESRGTKAVPAAPQSSKSMEDCKPEPVAQEEKPASVETVEIVETVEFQSEGESSDTSATADEKATRSYPSEIRKMAVNMRRRGKNPAAIIAAIHKKCGRAPDKSNLTRILDRWEKARNSSKSSGSKK